MEKDSSLLLFVQKKAKKNLGTQVTTKLTSLFMAPLNNHKSEKKKKKNTNSLVEHGKVKGYTTW
jgi:hypothetical protein